MKRSEINRIIREARDFLAEQNFHLPPWAFWSPEEWKEHYPANKEIIRQKLGWDITDFGSGDYYKTGLFLFTLRNSDPSDHARKYAEKIMIVGEDQVTPFHFHWSKAEDIINRGGGNLVIEMYASDEQEELSDKTYSYRVDGIEYTGRPGTKVILAPGESICFLPGLYHKFYGEPGAGKVLVGEVSTANDDEKDNRFLKLEGRFPRIEEDEPPVHLLVSDYPNFLTLK